MANTIMKRGRYSAAMKEECVLHVFLGQKTEQRVSSEPLSQWRDLGRAGFSVLFGAMQ